MNNNIPHIPLWLQDLESEAQSSLGEKMVGFNATIYACPWLRWYCANYSNKTPEVVLVLQDWGVNDGSGIDAAIEEVGLKIGDTTIKNIYAHDKLRKGLSDGSWCVMNAVWGLRKNRPSGERKTGYLGDAIHRAAWPIWSEAVTHLRPKKLITAGDWSFFPNYKWASIPGKSKDIARYFKLWDAWAKYYRASFSKSGKYQYCAHPATWGWTKQWPKL